MVRILWRFSKTFDQKEKKNTDKNLVIWGFGYLGIWLWIDEIDICDQKISSREMKTNSVY